MSIEKNFSRQVKLMERIPERSLYRQTRVLSRTLEKQTMKGFTDLPKIGGTGSIAREVLWFFATAILAILIALMLFYVVSHFLENILSLGIYVTGSVYRFFYLLVAVCFVGIYVLRLVNWAIKKMIINK